MVIILEFINKIFINILNKIKFILNKYRNLKKKKF